ncbi:MAG: hypothetical protein COC15_01250 [Legionellales bacterium]|nr:MAG: hypothetical protein COC15_01250 [Legionellales bacterium]
MHPLNIELNKQEWRNFVKIFAILFAYASALYMVFPVLTAYETQINTANGEPANYMLIGLALGIFGLSYALCLTPVRKLSEKIGRKAVIQLGLVLLIISSLVATISDSIYILILARALQGCCALGCILLTLIAENTRPELQLKITMHAEEAFRSALTFALVIGPFLEIFVGLQGIFLASAIIATGVLLWTTLATNKSNCKDTHGYHQEKVATLLTKFDKQQFMIMLLGTGTLHAMLAALFFIVPIMLRNLGIPHPSIVWQLCLFTSVGSILFAKLFLFKSQETKNMRLVCWAHIGLMLLAATGLWLRSVEYIWLWIGLLGCLIMFQFLEAKLQELMNLLAPSWHDYINSMEIYFKAQAIGLFIGATIAGIIYQSFDAFGIQAVLLVCMAFASVWFGIVWLLPFNQQNRFMIKLLHHFEKEDAEYRVKIEAAIAARAAENRA